MKVLSSRVLGMRRISFTTAVSAAALLLQAGSASALPCVEDKFGSKVNCTANDISITDVTNIVVTDDGCTSPDDQVTFNAKLHVVTTATERYDVGLFIGENGIQAITGQCFVTELPRSPAPFSNLDGDQCGDSTSAVVLDVPVTGVTVECEDANENGKLDLVTCTTWQNQKDGVCGSEADVEPGTSAKCNCPETPTDIEIDTRCTTDAQCEALATGCNIGDCDRTSPDADNFGCVFTPTDSLCDDGLFCNGTETCGDDGTCEDGTPPNCDDDVSCTNDRCEEATDACVSSPDDTICDDRLFCNGVETCDADAGCQAGTAPDCNDGVSCTNDSCNEATDACVNAPDDTICNDGLFCNGVETCSATQGCLAGTAPSCDDDVICTSDRCNEATDACVNAPDDTICDDGLFCNGVETCDADDGCQAGTAPNCDDEVSCTNDSCNEETDACVNAPDDTVCNDGLFCNGVETCDPDLGCQAGSAPSCDDDVNCTNDSCNEATDACVHTPDNTVCDNGLFCDGPEICNGTSGCQNGSAVLCDDLIACTLDACSETSDECITTGNESACDDENVCTEDACVTGVGCTHEGQCETGICRTAGFWGTHGGTEKGGTNITQLVLDEAGGLEICGQTIIDTGLNDLDSALEGLCVDVSTVSLRQLYRQLIAAALNCVISASSDCDTTIAAHTGVSFDDCNTLCGGGSATVTTGACIAALDCYNNGGDVINGKCATGNCNLTDAPCGGTTGPCPSVSGVPQQCIAFDGNCHDAPLCNTDLGICPDERLAGSARACSQATKNKCTIDKCI